jgi:hypothetical protein
MWWAQGALSPGASAHCSVPTGPRPIASRVPHCPAEQNSGGRHCTVRLFVDVDRKIKHTFCLLEVAHSDTHFQREERS